MPPNPDSPCPDLPRPCLHCGYDLRAHTSNTNCPECGNPVPAKGFSIPGLAFTLAPHKPNPNGVGYIGFIPFSSVLLFRSFGLPLGLVIACASVVTYSIISSSGSPESHTPDSNSDLLLIDEQGLTLRRGKSSNGSGGLLPWNSDVVLQFLGIRRQTLSIFYRSPGIHITTLLRFHAQRPLPRHVADAIVRYANERSKMALPKPAVIALPLESQLTLDLDNPPPPNVSRDHYRASLYASAVLILPLFFSAMSSTLPNLSNILQATLDFTFPLYVQIAFLVILGLTLTLLPRRPRRRGRLPVLHLGPTGYAVTDPDVVPRLKPWTAREIIISPSPFDKPILTLRRKWGPLVVWSHEYSLPNTDFATAQALPQLVRQWQRSGKQIQRHAIQST